MKRYSIWTCIKEVNRVLFLFHVGFRCAYICMKLHRSVCYELSLILRIACILLEQWEMCGPAMECYVTANRNNLPRMSQKQCVIKWVFPLQVHFSLSTLIITSILSQQLSFHFKAFVCNSFRINMLIKTYYNTFFPALIIKQKLHCCAMRQIH